MKNRPALYIVLGFVIGMTLSGVFATIAVNSENNGMMGMMGMQRGSMASDRHFIEQMIPHHDDAVKMARVAQTRAEHPQIKNLADDIEITQTKEIEEMREWYRDWYGKDPATGGVSDHHDMSGMQNGMMGNSKDLESLEDAKPFDKAFIEQMIPHHQMAVMMAQMVQQTARHDEVRQLAGDIIEAQNREIDQMRQWYRTWYGSGV